MLRMRVISCVFVCWFACFCAVSQGATSTTAKAEKSAAPVNFRVGGAYTDITPDHGMPNYNGDPLEPDKDATPLRVQAIVLDDGTTRAAILSVDCTFLGRKEVGRIREAIRRRVGIEPEHTSVAATHSHASPATTASFLTGAMPEPAYIDLLVEKASQAVEQAASRLKPARSCGGNHRRAADRGLSAPHRCQRPGLYDRHRAEVEKAFATRAPDRRADAICDIRGPRRQAAGSDVQFLVSQQHGASRIQRRYVRRAGDDLRAKLGDIATVMLAAPCGDVAWRNPGGRPTYPSDRAAGHAIADAILTSYKTKPYVDAGRIAVRSVLRQIPDRPYDPDSLHYDNGRGANNAARERFLTRYTPEEAAVRNNGDTKCDVEIQVIAFGDVAIVTNPAELFSIYGVKIKQASPYKVTFVSELSNGYCGYVPTPDSFKHGGYETYRTVYTCRLAKDGGDRIMRESIDLLRAVHEN